MGVVVVVVVVVVVAVVAVVVVVGVCVCVCGCVCVCLCVCVSFVRSFVHFRNVFLMLSRMFYVAYKSLSGCLGWFEVSYHECRNIISFTPCELGHAGCVCMCVCCGCMLHVSHMEVRYEIRSYASMFALSPLASPFEELHLCYFLEVRGVWTQIYSFACI